MAEELLQHTAKETETAAGAENQERRARARRSLLWAYASVAFVLLALAALGVGWRATQLREDAENQQRRAALAERRAGMGLRLWNLRELGASPVWYDYPGLDSVCFNPATSALLVGRSDGPVSHDWRAAGRDGKGLPGPSTPVLPMQGQHRNLLVLTNDGQRIAGVNADAGYISAANMAGTSELFLITGKYNTMVRSSSSSRGSGTLSFSPDKRWLACGVAGGEGTVVFDSTNGQPVKKVDPVEGAVQFSPDGRWLVIAHTGRCQLVRTTDWQTAWEKRDLPRYAATTAAFSPDGNLVAAPDSAITVAAAAFAPWRLRRPCPLPSSAGPRTAAASSAACAIKTSKHGKSAPSAGS